MTVSPLILEKGGSHLKQLWFLLSENFTKNEILRLNSLHNDARNILREDIFYNYEVRKSFLETVAGI